MSKTIHIQSQMQLDTLLSTSNVVVIDFYADWCGPCKAVAPLFEELSAQLSRPNRVTFAKVNTDEQKDVAAAHNITSLPTFKTFKAGQETSKIQGVRPKELSDEVKKLAAEVDGGKPSDQAGESSSGADKTWLGAGLPRGYTDVTSQVDVRGVDLLNADAHFGGARVLFDGSVPSTLESSKGKSKAETEEPNRDWVESDTDDQLMLFMPFNAALKIHTIHLTSLPPSASEDAKDVPMRPKTVQLFSNRSHNLGFEEAEDMPATQEITFNPEDWDSSTGTAKAELRFVKFQNVTSLVLFVVNGEGNGDRVRLDRVRLIGETGEKREMGKLEKIGNDQ